MKRRNGVEKSDMKIMIFCTYSIQDDNKHKGGAVWRNGSNGRDHRRRRIILNTHNARIDQARIRVS